MASTGWLWATTADPSGGGRDAVTGAPNGVTFTFDVGFAGTTAGGFGVQAAIGAQPTSVDAVEVALVARRQDAGSTTVVVAGQSVPVALTTTLAQQTVTLSTVPSWAALGTLTVGLPEATNASAKYIVDAVGVRVTYTTTVDHPLTGSVAVASGTAGQVIADRPLAGSTPVTATISASFDVMPGGLSGVQAATSTVTGTLRVLAPLAGTVPIQSAASGHVGARFVMGGLVAATTAAAGAIGRVEILVVRAQARTIDQLLSGSHRREDHIIILSGDRAGERLPIVGGDLLIDEAADVRATGTLTLPDLDWVGDLLDPLTTRTELAVVLAVRGDDDQLHTWQHAVVHPVRMPLSVSATHGRQWSVDVADRGDWVAKTGMREHYAGAGDVSIVEHAVRLVLAHAPWLPTGTIDDPGYTSGADLMVGGVGDDPWAAAVQLAWMGGVRLHIDHEGRLSGVRIVGTPSPPSARWVAGENGCHIAEMSTDRSDADIVNALGVPWEEAKPDDAPESWTPTGGVEWWEDTHPVIGIHGVLGQRARKWAGDSSVIHTAAHARDVATSHGLTQAGARAGVDFAVKLDPRLRVGDTIRVRRPELRLPEGDRRLIVARYQLGGPLLSGSLGAERII